MNNLYQNYGKFQTLKQEEALNPAARALQYQYNGRIFFDPKQTPNVMNLGSESNFSPSLDGFYMPLNAPKRERFEDINSARCQALIKTASEELAQPNLTPQQRLNINKSLLQSGCYDSRVCNGGSCLVDIGPQESTNIKAFDMFYGESNKQHLDDSIITNKVGSTKLSRTFFSEPNQNRIQQLVMDRISQVSGGQYKISRQSDTQLQVIMRSIYLQFGKNLDYNIEQQVNTLNTYVVNECVRIIVPNIQQYQGYIRDITNPVPNMPLPQYVGNKGKNTFELLIV